MWRASAGLIAGLLAIAGCKSTAPKPADKKDQPVASTKGRNSTWLDDTTGSVGTDVAKGGRRGDARDPNLDPGNENRGLLAGVVLGPAGNGANGVYIRIEPVGVAPRSKDAAPIGIYTDSSGHFMTVLPLPNQAYILTAEATINGRTYSGTVQTRPPRPNITIALRDDLVFPAPAPEGAPRSDGLPPGRGPAAGPAEGDLPPPTGLIAPADVAPTPPRPADGGAWSPGGTGAATNAIPATIIPPAPQGPPLSPLPQAAPRPSSPSRPEYNTTGPFDPFKPAPASIPNPSVPQMSLPPGATPAPTTTPPSQTRSYRPVRPEFNFTLVDGLERPWEYATHRSGHLVLLDFMTTTCAPCKETVPILVDIQARYAINGLQVLGVVCDEAPLKDRLKLAAKYERTFGMNYLLYTEPGAEPGAVRNRFLGAQDGYPTAVLLDEQGKVVWKGNPHDKANLESAILQQLRK